MTIPRWTDQVLLEADDLNRYRLLRAAPGGRGARRLVVIGLNPSDGGQVHVESKGDSTIRTVEQWASGLHAKTMSHPDRPRFGEVLYLNLFAWRHGQAIELDKSITDHGYEFAVGGKRNQAALTDGTSRPEDIVVAMWGNANAIKDNRHLFVKRIAEVLDIVTCDLWRVGDIAPGQQPEHGYRWNFGTGLLHPWRVNGRFV